MTLRRRREARGGRKAEGGADGESGAAAAGVACSPAVVVVDVSGVRIGIGIAMDVVGAPGYVGPQPW